MAKVLTDSSNYTSIANAIREKLGVESTFAPADMAAAIASISGDGEAKQYVPTWDSGLIEHSGVVVVKGNFAYFDGYVRIQNASNAPFTICTVPIEIAPPVSCRINYGYFQRSYTSGSIGTDGVIKIGFQNNTYQYIKAVWPVIKKTNEAFLQKTVNVSAPATVTVTICDDIAWCHTSFTRGSASNDWLDLFIIPEEIRPSGDYIPYITGSDDTYGVGDTTVYDSRYNPESGVISAWLPASRTKYWIDFMWKL